ncbi:MAG: STELLO glycosyltransferase family protein [Bacteroidota bacterium]|nr:STELLO glycosyltransferase family protein [Bacteroidota bacterium]
MNTDTALVITSIAGPENAVLLEYAAGCRERGITFIVIGDVPSPKDFNLEGCDFYGLEAQKDLPYAIAGLLPLKHYARKNLGYLLARSQGKKVIIETDDDNFPREAFWAQRNDRPAAHSISDSGWVNVYRYFTKAHIWPRGLPLDRIMDAQPVTVGPAKEMHCPIQQGLADENPDVDAVYRLTCPLPVSFEIETQLALGREAWSPFNSQNTTWFEEAFPLLYLPSYCSFRMTDIWRSFVAQRIAWENGWSIFYHAPTVWQERNAHNLMRDFADEVPGYLHNEGICKHLSGLTLEPGKEKLTANLLECYVALTDGGYIDKKEMPLVEAWVRDVEG